MTQSPQSAAAFEAVGVGVIVISENGVPRYANRAARELFGFTATGPAETLVDTQPFLMVFEHCRQDSRHECAEFVYEKNRKTYKVIARAVPRPGRGFIIALPDITREKEAERAKTEFVALASHQLRTPLSVMKWILEGLERKRGERRHADFHRRFKRLTESNEQMITLVNDLLNASRLEAGKLIPSPIEVDLRVMTDHIAGEFMAKMKEKGIAFERRLGSKPATVLVDTKFIHEIMTNLVSNAVKYTPSGGRITVRVENRDRDHFAWIIADTGVGIPASEHRQVFDKFFRGENVAGTEIQGTGLGLYVAMSMVRASGGTIRFASTEGKGSTFTVLLPKSRR